MLTWTPAASAAPPARSTSTAPTTRSRTPQRLIDWLAARPEVAARRGRATRASAWSAAPTAARWRCCWPAQDQRVDAIVPMITWNDLCRRVPARVDRQGPGRRRVQEGRGPASSSARRRRRAASAAARRRSDGPQPAAADAVAPTPQCGRFAADICAVYHDVATTGRPTRPTWRCCAGPARRRSWTGSRRRRCSIQGQADSLFPLERGRRQRPRHRRHRHPGAGRLVHRRPRRRQRPAVRPGPAEVPDRAVARPLRQAARATPRRRSFTYSRVAGLDARDRAARHRRLPPADVPGPGRRRPPRA